MCGFWKAFKLKSKCRCLLISVPLLISSCTKPYLPAELTLENLPAVLASFTYRLEHVPENVMKVCYNLNTFNIYNTIRKMSVYKVGVHG